MNHRAWLTLAAAYVNVNELGVLIEHFGAEDAIVQQAAGHLRDAGLPEKKSAGDRRAGYRGSRSDAQMVGTR